MDSFPAHCLPQAGCLLGWGLFLLEGRCSGAVEAYVLLACLEMDEVSCLFGGNRKFPSKSEPFWGERVSWEVLGLC